MDYPSMPLGLNIQGPKLVRIRLPNFVDGILF